MKKLDWKKFTKETEKRNKKIFAEYKKGKKTMSMIGDEYGITRSRVSYIVKAEVKKSANIDIVDGVDKR